MQTNSEADRLPAPKGTLFLMSLYLLVLGITWLVFFLGLIAR